MNDSQSVQDMTFEKKLIWFLEGRGLWPDEAAKVMGRLKETDKVMTGRWDHRVSDYPATMFAVLTLSARDEAVAFLEEENPNHFALSLLKA